jgi:hypothetical protein
MRVYFKLMMVLVVVGALLVGYVLLATGQKKTVLPKGVESEDPSGQETYVSEVIIQAPWGEKNLYKWAGGEESPPGEFGHYVSRETELGPNTFTVAPNGDIYINDQLNKRIQRFGPDGEFICVIPIEGGFMCVDRENNIYTTRLYPAGFIDKYDQAGSLLKSYPVEVERRQLKSYPMEIETNQIVGIYCDNLGRVYAAFHYNYRKVDKVGEKRKTIIDTTWGGLCHVRYAEPAFSFEEQKSTIKKEAFLGSNSVALSEGYFKGGGGNLYLISFGGDTIKTFKSIEGSFFGCDEELNVYAHQYDEKKHAMVVRKYNPKGGFLSIFQYWCDKPHTGIFTGFGFSSVIGGFAFLDSKGNVYVFCQSHKDGIKVTKWYKSD